MGNFFDQFDPKEEHPKHSTGADVGYSFATGVPRGFLASAAQMGGHLPTSPGYLATLADDASKGLELLGVHGARDAVKDVRSHLGAFGMTADDTQRLYMAAAQYAGLHPDYKPQTVAGQYARTGGEFAGASVIGGPARGIAGRAAASLVPAALSETAGQLTKGTKWEQAARMAAALGTGAAMGAVGVGGPNGAQRIMGNAMGETTAAQRAAAIQRMELGAANEHPLTVAEAMDTTTRGASRLTGVQRDIEPTSAGVTRLGPMMAQRPQRAQAMVARVLDEIAPRTDPRQVAANAQSAAEHALTTTRQGINQRARPNYDNLRDQTLPQQAYAQVVQQNPSYQVALRAIRESPELNARIATLPDNSLAVVNEVMKRLGTMERNATENPANPMGDNTLAGIRSEAQGNVNQMIGRLTDEGAIPQDYQAAHRIVAQGRQNALTPLQMGPLGEISAVGQRGPVLDAPAMGRALYPTAPPEGQPFVTAQAMGHLGEAGPPVTRSFLGQQMGEQFQNQQGQPNQWAGSRFSTQVAGNPIQRDTLLSGVGEASPRAAGRLADALDVLDTSGARLRPGSPTAEKLAANKDTMAAGSVVGNVLAAARGPKIFDKVADALNKFDLEWNQNALARALSADPDAARRILEIANRARDNTATRRAGVAAALAGMGAQAGQ